jgi:hypothetical protein
MQMTVNVDPPEYAQPWNPAMEQHPVVTGEQSLAAADVADFIVELFRGYAGVELSPEQRAAAVQIALALGLPRQASVESFVEGCEGNPLLKPWAGAIRSQLAKPSIFSSIGERDV